MQSRSDINREVCWHIVVLAVVLASFGIRTRHQQHIAVNVLLKQNRSNRIQGQIYNPALIVNITDENKVLVLARSIQTATTNSVYRATDSLLNLRERVLVSATEQNWLGSLIRRIRLD